VVVAIDSQEKMCSAKATVIYFNFGLKKHFGIVARAVSTTSKIIAIGKNMTLSYVVFFWQLHA